MKLSPRLPGGLWAFLSDPAPIEGPLGFSPRAVDEVTFCGSGRGPAPGKPGEGWDPPVQLP